MQLETKWRHLHKNWDHIEQTGKNEWTILSVIYVPTPYGRMLIYPGYSFDKDSVVKNLPDWVPSLVHDLAYDHRIDWSGGPVNRKQADLMYYWLNQNSICETNRKRAWLYYKGVRAGGWWAWHIRPRLFKSVVRPKPIPAHARYLYGL